MLLMLFIISLGCAREKPVSGYFKVLYKDYENTGDLYSKMIGDTTVGGDTNLRRISGDTIISYSLSSFALDSVVHVWNGEDYRRHLSPTTYHTYGSVNKKYVKIDENTLEIGVDTLTLSGLEKEAAIYVEKQMGDGFTDTLYRITKAEFMQEIREYKRLDSIAYYEPYIRDYDAISSIKWYIDFYMEEKGELVEGSITLQRQRDDLFHVKFKLRIPIIKSEDIYLYSFDFNNNGRFTATPL